MNSFPAEAKLRITPVGEEEGIVDYSGQLDLHVPSHFSSPFHLLVFPFEASYARNRLGNPSKCEGVAFPSFSGRTWKRLVHSRNQSTIGRRDVRLCSGPKVLEPLANIVLNAEEFRIVREELGEVDEQVSDYLNSTLFKQAWVQVRPSNKREHVLPTFRKEAAGKKQYGVILTLDVALPVNGNGVKSRAKDFPSSRGRLVNHQGYSGV